MIKKEIVYENIRLLHVTDHEESDILLSELAQYAIDRHLVVEGYKEAILEREKSFPTGIKAVTGIGSLLHFHPLHALALVAISLLLTVISGIIPAISASRKNVVDALRVE